MIIEQKMRTAILRLLRPRTIERLRGILAWLLWISGLTFCLRMFIRPQGAAILVYHSIGGKGVFPDNVVSLRNFKRHVEYLQKNFILVSVSKIVERIRSKRLIPNDWVAITFW